MKQQTKNKLLASFGVAGLAAIGIPFLASCTADIPELNAAEIINTMFPNVWVFIAQVIAMCFVFSIILWMIWKPTNKMLDRRREYIAKEITDAEKAKEEAMLYMEEAKKEQLEATNKANEIIASAKTEASNYMIEQERLAKENADHMIKSATTDIENQYKSNLDRLTREAKEAAFVAAEALIKKNITRADNDKLVDEFIKDFDSSSPKKAVNH